MSDRSKPLTNLLNRAAQGDSEAAGQVFPAIYEELRKLAHSQRRHFAAGETLRVTALVHEAYLRVVDREPEGWQARSHFFHAAARAMRDILVEEARRKSALKHGGGQQRLDLEFGDVAIEAPVEDVLSLDLALTKLESKDPEGFHVVMLRYFTGLTVPEVAEVMGVSSSTIERKWRFLRAWLAQELRPAV